MAQNRSSQFLLYLEFSFFFPLRVSFKIDMDTAKLISGQGTMPFHYTCDIGPMIGNTPLRHTHNPSIID